MKSIELLRSSLQLENIENISSMDIVGDINHIYRLFLLERTVRFYGQKFWESESRFESARPGKLQLENVAAHSFQVANAVILLGQHFPELNISQAVKLAIVHDQLEIITGDKDPVGKIGDGSDTHAFSSVKRKAKLDEEAGALEEFIDQLRPGARSEFRNLITEATAENTIESRFVKAVDKLQALAFVRVKKAGDIGPAHLSFTLRYAKQGLEKFPKLQQHFTGILSDILKDVESLYPANFTNYCETTWNIYNGVPPVRKSNLMKIALLGKSGVGKSTVAKLLYYYLGSERISSGIICRQIANLLFGNEDKSTTQKLDDALTPIDSSIFLNAALLSAPTNRPICVDSLRFKSDYEIAKREGFTIVRVVAPDNVRVSRLIERGQNFDLNVDGTHRSETELDNVSVDFLVENSGDMATLEASLKDLIG